MQLVRYHRQDQEKIGILEGDVIREISVDAKPGMPPIVAAATNPDGNETGKTVSRDQVKIGAPIERPGKIVCVGLNYREHAKEGDNPIPDSPLLFGKATSSVIGPNDPIVYPFDIEKLDYEAELGVVIGQRIRRISADQATDAIAGFTVFNDVTARDVQYSSSQFFRGKSYDTFAPTGPAIVTPDELDPTDLSIRTLVNGTVRQDSSTSDMIFDVPTLVESISRTMTLYPGDVIATGTPEGVGVHADPPNLLETGDLVEVEIEGIGSLQNRVTAEERKRAE